MIQCRIKPPEPQTPVRPRERRHVTIVAGFKCYEGVVLCADTQETVAELSKRNIPKLIFEPKDDAGKTKAFKADDLAVAFCGAADNGPFVDKLVQNAWEDAQAGSNIDEVCTLIERSIELTYKKFGEIFQTGYCPTAEVIYGVKMFGASKLFSASGPIVTEQNRYATGGAGYYMADFLSSRMYTNHLSLRQCAILCAYILFQAKEHVDGCGGDSQIAVLRNDGVSGAVDRVRIESLNRLLDGADETLGHLLLAAADLEVDDRRFIELIEGTQRVLENSRRQELQDYRHVRSISDHVRLNVHGRVVCDEFGLPMPSDSRTSED